MKRTSIGLTVGLSLILSACATSRGSAMRAGGNNDGDIDQAKIVSVNQWAEIRGAKVLWINLPQKSKLIDGDDKATLN